MAERPPGGPPVRPRDAASLLLVRERSGRREVLVGRRNDRHDFLPGVYVFPGGAVEASDSRAPCGTRMSRVVHGALARHASPARARALAVAALREAWEEAGVCVGEVRCERLVPDLGDLLYIARAITPTRLRTRFDARFFAARYDVHSRVSPGVSGELQDLRWIDAGHPGDQLPMLDVTRFVIRQVAALTAWRQPSDVPMLCFRAGRPMLRRG